MKSARLFDLRLLFSPIISPPEEKALIYVLFFAVRLCGSQASSVLKHGGEVIL